MFVHSIFLCVKCSHESKMAVKPSEQGWTRGKTSSKVPWDTYAHTLSLNLIHFPVLILHLEILVVARFHYSFEICKSINKIIRKSGYLYKKIDTYSQHSILTKNKCIRRQTNFGSIVIIRMQAAEICFFFTQYNDNLGCFSISSKYIGENL